MSGSPSVFGADIRSAASFAFTFTSSGSTPTPIAGGGYEVTASQDCDCVVSSAALVGGATTATALPSTQATPGSAAVARVRLFANQSRPLDIPEDGAKWWISAVRVSADGTLTVNGPLRKSLNR